VPLHCEYLPATQAAQQELVLLHGWGCNLEVWRPLLVLLRPWANITLVDLPGCAPGVSIDKPPSLTELIESILDCSPERAVVVGWSLGGQIALELAEREPERVLAVVTICTNPLFAAANDWPGMDAEVFNQFSGSVRANPAAALKRFDTLQVTGARQQRRMLRQLQNLQRPPASAELLVGLGWLETLDNRELLARLRQPQLHLFAERDALVPAAVCHSIANRLAAESTVQVKILPEVCHLAPLDCPVELQQHIRQFLSVTGTLHKRPAVTPERAKKDVAASFSRAAAAYDSVAHLQREVGEQLLTCLNQWEGAPTTVLDLGCGTGYFCAELKRHYPGARYLGLDLAPGMVAFARERCEDDCDWLVADAEALPLGSESVDLVFSSLALQWCYHPEHLFAELVRVLRPGGLCVFTSLGPDTLKELRSAWAAVDSHQHVNTFLPGAELEETVGRITGLNLRLERRTFRMEYERVRDLLDELKALGAHNMNPSRPSGLTSRRALQGMLQAYEAWRIEGVLPATYEVIFGVLEKA
jgi:malonyl-CoA O-methyltransferase